MSNYSITYPSEFGDMEEVFSEDMIINMSKSSWHTYMELHPERYEELSIKLEDMSDEDHLTEWCVSNWAFKTDKGVGEYFIDNEIERETR